MFKKIIPNPRTEVLYGELPALVADISLADKADALVKAAAEGVISVDAANSLMSLLERKVKIQELTELTEKVNTILKHLGLDD